MTSLICKLEAQNWLLLNEKCEQGDFLVIGNIFAEI